MLSNSDFASLLSSGDIGNNNNNNDGKKRYDLKQVSDWDKQNEAAIKVLYHYYHYNYYNYQYY